MLSRLPFVFLFVVQTHSLAVLTDDKSQTTKTDGETVLVRQLLNQETLIRMALDRKVNELVKGMAEMKKNMETSNQQLQDAKREIQTNNKQLQDAKRAIETNNQQLQNATTEIVAIKNENSALNAEWQAQKNITTFLSDNLKTTINTMKQSQNSQQELSSAVSSLQAVQRNLSQLSGSAVGFTVGVTSSDGTWAGDILVFPHNVTNTGHYNTQTGKFLAPRDGMYVFFVVAVSQTNNVNLRLDIVHDGNSKVRTDSHSSDLYQTASNLAVLMLEKGDSVWVKRHEGEGYHSYSVPYTTFSGFLL